MMFCVSWLTGNPNRAVGEGGQVYTALLWEQDVQNSEGPCNALG